jgi:Domain of unknown function (DUF4258)
MILQRLQLGMSSWSLNGRKVEWNRKPILTFDYQNAPCHNDGCMARNVIPLVRPRAATPEDAVSPAAFELRVHELAKVSTNIHFGHPHFRDRLVERGLTMRQVLEVLRKGCITDGPTKDKWGDWRVKLQRRVAGRRVQIVVAVKENHLDVVTAI